MMTQFKSLVFGNIERVFRFAFIQGNKANTIFFLKIKYKIGFFKKRYFICQILTPEC